MARIIILSHRHVPLDCQTYFMGEMADMWRADGHDVREQRGPCDDAAGDICILHVDLTVAPGEYVDYARRFPVAINAGTADTSKRRIATGLLAPSDGWTGPVIVKTNRNHHGLIESRLAAAGLMPGSFARVFPEYPILGSMKEVPAVAWTNPDLVVERFQPERHEGLYCLRVWMFMGDRETSARVFSYHPIVKSANIVGREAVPDVPEDLRRLRRELGFDFGKFDYGIVDGRVVLYDANRTPTVGNFPREQYLPRVRHLADGIKAFLR